MSSDILTILRWKSDWKILYYQDFYINIQKCKKENVKKIPNPNPESKFQISKNRFFTPLDFYYLTTWKLVKQLEVKIKNTISHQLSNGASKFQSWKQTFQISNYKLPNLDKPEPKRKKHCPQKWNPTEMNFWFFIILRDFNSES